MPAAPLAFNGRPHCQYSAQAYHFRPLNSSHHGNKFFHPGSMIERAEAHNQAHNQAHDQEEKKPASSTLKIGVAQ